MPNNTGGSRRQTLLNLYRVLTVCALVVIAATSALMLNKLADRPDTPTAAEIAQAINGSAEFQRPSDMEYVAKTNSCVVGGTVTSTKWHVGDQTVKLGEVDGNTVDYTTFGFESDDGQVFTVSDNGALYVEPGENLGLELRCDPVTLSTTPSFGLIAIIYGGK